MAQHTERLIEEYLKSRRLRETAADMENRYKKELMDLLAAEGEEDDRGSCYLPVVGVVDPRTGEPVASIKRERRVGQTLDEDAAAEILSDLGLLDRCTTTITVLDEDAILALNMTDELSDDVVQQMYVERESFAFKIIHGSED